MLKISVPLTTANIGPGFDALALALDAFNVYTFSSSKKMALKGFPQAFSNENNLVYQVYLDMHKKNNRPLFPVEINFSQGLPLCGGVGSSATAIIAAIIAYKYFCNEKFTKIDLINEALNYEKHPDNIAAAVLGGLVSVYFTNNEQTEVNATKLYIDTNWKVYLFIPNISLSTEYARSILPQEIRLNDAIFNMQRAILIPNALAHGDEEQLFNIMDDRLHEPYRLKLIPGANLIKDYAKNNGYPCFLSGAGASMAIITKRNLYQNFSGWEKRQYSIYNNGTLFTE